MTTPDWAVEVPEEKVILPPTALMLTASPDKISISPVPDPALISMPPLGAARVRASAVELLSVSEVPVSCMVVPTIKALSVNMVDSTPSRLAIKTSSPFMAKLVLDRVSELPPTSKPELLTIIPEPTVGEP